MHWCFMILEASRHARRSKDVDEDLAAFYVFRDDIVMFPISYSIPKDQGDPQLPKEMAYQNDVQEVKDIASMLNLDETMKERSVVVVCVRFHTYVFSFF